MRFALLGDLLVDDGNGERPISARRHRALLATLLLQANRVVAWDEAARQIWSGDPPPAARTTLHGYALRLRRALGPVAAERVATRDAGYFAEVRPGELDLDVFAELRGRGETAAREGLWKESRRYLSDALALWRGEPLLDVLGLADRDDVVRLWTEIRLQTLEARIAADLELGLHETVLTELSTLAGQHPLRERFTGQLMLALYRSDRQADALAAYRGVWTKLDEEIGVEPGSALRDLHQRILERDPALHLPHTHQDEPVTLTPPVHGRPAQLPPTTADISGRTEQARALEECLVPPDGPGPDSPRLVAVTGPGGIGKTTLAVHVAHRLRRAFPDGQLFADLAGADADPVAPQEIQGRFLRALGVPHDAIPAAEAERTAFYRTVLAERRLLIVLDNAAGAEQLRSLLPGSGPSAVLVTSRDALTHLPFGQVTALGLLAETDARALFERIVGADRTRLEPQAVDAILEACGGLPLALRIAGARLAARPNWTLRSLADRLADTRERLGELAVGDLSVRTSLSVGYEGLRAGSNTAVSNTAVTLPAGLSRSIGADHYFRLLGLASLPHFGPQAVAALFDMSPRQSSALLERFVDARLLDAAHRDRYRFHDLTRLFAAEAAFAEESEAERTAAMDRLAGWYLASAEAAANALRPGVAPTAIEQRTRHRAQAERPADRLEALAWFEDERVNLVALSLRAHEFGLWQCAWRIPEAMRAFFIVRRYWDDWIRTYEAGLAAARACGDGLGEARLRDGLGVAYGDVHRFAEAAEMTQSAVAAYHAVGRRDLEAAASSNLSGALARLGRFAEGIAAARAALEIQLADGQLNVAATTWSNLGMLQFHTGEHETAIESYLTALDLSRRTNHKYAEAAILSNLGEAYTAVNKPALAIEYCLAALPMCDALGTEHGRAMTLDNLAEALWQTGREQDAVETWEQALKIFDGLGAPDAEQVRRRLMSARSSLVMTHLS